MTSCFRWVLPLLFLLLCARCAASPVAVEADSGTDLQVEVEPFAQAVQLAVAGGEPDLGDRYPTTVLIASDRTPGLSGTPGYCSGVLVEPDLVLSAAHCMCLPAIHTAKGTSVNRSSCAKGVRVIRPSYEFQEESAETAGGKKPRRLAGIKYPEIRGVPFLPEEFRVDVDEAGTVRSRIADFAIIRLQKRVPVRIDYRLPDREVAIGESIVMVGFGNMRQHNTSAAILRYYGDNKVTGVRLLEDEDNPARDKERVEIYFHRKKTGAHAEQGDSGGPCFRENEQGRFLVGIVHSSVPDGRTSVLLSTFHSKGLIDKLIAAARAKID
ncbi:MAG: trypsin-like serine protease [Myxococcaceae bacterium]|nr:trypsin-like serine protease [Myxococcaceae bacterium]